MGNTQSSPHPKTDLYPYLDVRNADHQRITMLIVPSSQGYGVVSPTSPGFDEQAFFDDIIEQPLVAAAPGEKSAVKQRKSWESTTSSNKTQRFSLDTAIDSAIGAWQRVKPRKASYGKIADKQMTGIEWEAE